MFTLLLREATDMDYIFSIDDSLKFTLDVGKVQPDKQQTVPEPNIAISALQGAVSGFVGIAAAVPEE